MGIFLAVHSFTHRVIVNDLKLMVKKDYIYIYIKEIGVEFAGYQWVWDFSITA